MIDPQWEERRLLLTHMLSILKRRRVEVTAYKQFDFQSPYNGKDFWVALEEGEPMLFGNAYYIHPHNGDKNWAGEQKKEIPHELLEHVYDRVREDLIEHFQSEIKSEERERKERAQLDRLLKKYGVPEQDE